MSNASDRTKLILAFAAIYLIWGSSYLAIRFAIETLPGFTMASARYLLAGGVLYGWARWKGAARPTWPQWRTAALLGFLLFAVGNGGVVWAQHHIPSGLAALLITTEPLWVALLASRSGEAADRVSGRTVTSLVLGFAGAALLIAPAKLGGAPTSPIAALVVMTSAFAWAYGSVHSRDAKLPSSLALAASMQMLAGGVALALFGGWMGEWSAVELGAVSAKSVLAFLYLIVFATLIAFSSYIWLLRTTAPSKVATYAYVNPLVAVFLGWLLADEPVGPRTILAGVLILLSVLLVSRSGGHGRRGRERRFSFRPRRDAAAASKAALREAA